jgi:hypothetical protein
LADPPRGPGSTAGSMSCCAFCTRLERNMTVESQKSRLHVASSDKASIRDHDMELSRDCRGIPGRGLMVCDMRRSSIVCCTVALAGPSSMSCGAAM